MKIAVCDDEIQFVNVTCEMLKEWAYLREIPLTL